MGPRRFGLLLLVVDAMATGMVWFHEAGKIVCQRLTYQIWAFWQSTGYGGGRTRGGHFLRAALGDGQGLVRLGIPPYVLVRKGIDYVLVNFCDPTKTREVYGALMASWPSAPENRPQECWRHSVTVGPTPCLEEPTEEALTDLGRAKTFYAVDQMGAKVAIDPLSTQGMARCPSEGRILWKKW